MKIRRVIIFSVLLVAISFSVISIQARAFAPANEPVIQATAIAPPPTDEPLTGMGNGLQSLWTVFCLLVLVVLFLGIMLAVMFMARKRRPPAHRTGGQPTGTVQDKEGRWWYQDPESGEWSLWNGSSWQLTTDSPAAKKPAPRAVKSRGGGSSCLFTFTAAFVLAAIVIGGISLTAFGFFPGHQIQWGQGDVNEILKMGGGGLLMIVLGLLVLNGGFKSVITRRAIVEDDWGRRREKRGCSAVLNGLGQLALGSLLLAGGIGLATLVFYQEILPLLGGKL